jgi:hypothetical protein
MLSRFISLFTFMMVLGICDYAWAGGGAELGSNQQSPLQVIVAIVISAIILRVLTNFKLP